MPKFSVKKPMTVFVVVIIIIALGVVSILGMTPDLLPSIDLPYVVVFTTYPGATPEEVETTVTKPLEQGLGTIEDLKNMQSISSANFSIVILEFENDTSMESAVVNILQATDLVEGSFPDMVSAPYIMKLNPNMMPISIAAVDKEGATTEEISTFVKETLMPELEGITGVASVQTGGLIESKVNVNISEEKIEKLNKKLISQVNSKMADARSQLLEGQKLLEKADAEFAKAKEDYKKTKSDTYDGLAKAAAELDAAMIQANAVNSRITALEAEKATINALPPMMQDEERLAEIEKELGTLNITKMGADQYIEQVKALYEQAERGSYDAIEGFADAEKQLNAGEEELQSQKAQLESALKQINSAANTALSQANLGSMITMDMVSGVLTAQNFSMPAGYIQDKGAKYLVSVGDKINDIDELENMFLFNVQGLGDIVLNDVADVFIADNSKDVYASINGNPGVTLSFSKASNYPTATTSNNIADKFKELEAKYDGLKFTSLMDQGQYIYLIIGAIAESLGWGALFAILILLFFLRDLKPTIITILSIPISLMFAITLMYFTGVTLNMISLSGLAIAVGMLVDNSIVVIENIFRLRRLGISAKKAAVAGAKQVAAAIASSTLTTVCVFVPIVFTHGITRQLFTDMALTITYALLASLIIALTLVPAMASKMFEKNVRPEGKGFVKFRKAYMRLVNWNLKHKFLVLFLALALLVFSVYAAIIKGFIFLPDMSTPQMAGSMTMNDEEASLEDTKKMADEVIKRIETVEGVDTVGGMLQSNSVLTGETSSTTVSLYVIVDQESKASGGDIAKSCNEICKDLDCKVEILSSSSITSYTSALGGSGVGIEIYSNDADTLEKSAKAIGRILEGVDGIKEVNNGLEKSDPEYHFTVDKEAAMREGLTVAQVYMAVQNALTYESTSTTLQIEGDKYDVVVVDTEAKEFTMEDIKGLEIEGSNGTVKLSDIAKLEKTSALASVQRLNQRTYLTVTGQLEEGYNVTLVTQAAEKALEDYKAPEGVTYEFSGENEMIMDAMEDLVKMMALGILFVYLIMVAQFQSLRSPFIIMFTIPLAFTGGLLALLIFHKEISIMAMIGLIMLVGIIVNNGIVLVDYINQLRAEGYEKRKAIVLGGATRIRPVLMTSLTTILGLVVMAIGKTAGTDMMQPIALVCIGGLVYATILTLFIVPVIYDIFTGKEFHYTKEEDLDVSDIMLE